MKALECIGLLCPHGQVDSVDDSGRIALHMASKQGSPEIVKAFLENRGDPHLEDDLGAFPMHNATDSRSRQGIQQLMCVDRSLFEGEKHPWRRCVERQAWGAPCPIHKDDVGNSSGKRDPIVHGFILRGDVDAANMLLAAAASMREMTDWRGRTPLHVALLRGLPEMVKVMRFGEAFPSGQEGISDHFSSGTEVQPAGRNITVDAQQEARSLQTVVASASCVGGSRRSTLRFRILLTSVN